MLSDDARIAAAELDKRLSIHEMQCAERYGTIIETLNHMRNNFKMVHNRMYNWLVAGIGLLSTIIASLMGYIVARMH